MNSNLRFSAIANLRVVAIVAIILNHAQIGMEDDTRYSLGYLIYGQFFKFGSLLFMVISGFLFQNSIERYTHLELLKRKVLTILLPSLLFMLPWLVLNVGVLPLVGENRQDITPAFVGKELYNLFFRSIYWFPVNLFLIIMLNTLIKSERALKFLFLPAIVLTLFYSINIYYNWVPRKHNSAILAYFTFFFGGRFCYLYFEKLKALLMQLKGNRNLRSGSIAVLPLFFALSVYESYTIQALNLKTDPGNILRISNIAYTFTLLALVFNYRHKIKTGDYFKEKSVFLIYLIHPYWLFMGKHLAFTLGYSSSYHSSYNIPFEILYGAIVLVLSLLLARAFERSPLLNQLLRGRIPFSRTGLESQPSV